MLVQLVLRPRRVAALLAHVQLVAPLLVGVGLRDAVDFLHVGLQGAALREGLLAQRALVGPHSCDGGRARERQGVFPTWFICSARVEAWTCQPVALPTCVRAHVPLEVKRVVEAFAAEGARVPLGLVVALDVSV